MKAKRIFSSAYEHSHVMSYQTSLIFCFSLTGSEGRSTQNISFYGPVFARYENKTRMNSFILRYLTNATQL